MSELVKKQLEEAKDLMNKAVDHVENELTKIRAGKATPQMLDGIHVDYYGSLTPLAQIANINTPDARTIVVQPWEKNMIPVIEKAISDANLGINPQNDGIVIRLSIPALTEERRKDLVKKVKAEGEAGKVAVRNIRKDTNERIKKLQKEGVSEDEVKVGETEVQKLTDSYILKIDKHIEVKEKDIMTV
ncbi:MAG: ribosome recycling factor [bacterium]|jgi:ribosome recycling factor